ncbi:MAG: sulfatase [bacterium]|nr:sulfatase [bacterium]
MKAIMVMFDSLNRHMLPPYGCDWVQAPNFKRLAERSVVFDRAYVGSMPCMPARRELHTGRYNFLHRGWGPLEPWDDSAPQILQENGVYTHMTTDHYHYWEDGGCTYHPRYSSFEFHRGQEGDIWKAEVADPEIPEHAGQIRRADIVNRKYMDREELHSQYRTFENGLEFIRTNHDQDQWFLHIETFDPHEPYFSHQKYKDLYPHDYDGPLFDWPSYTDVTESRAQVEHIRLENAALVSMCDAHLGKVLDMMDEYGLWDDTMLIVNTDHGFLLGEHEKWAKCWLPFYEEVAHMPLFIWDPRCAKAGERRQALVQTIDLAPTLLDFFGVTPPPDMQGVPLAATIADDTPVREGALFGMHGAHVNVTDGRYVYMRGPDLEGNQPLYNYTTMATHMRGLFRQDELTNMEIAEPFSFTKGCQMMKCPAQPWQNAHRFGTMLFDLETDPKQEQPLDDPAVEQRMVGLLDRLMRESDAPPEQWERLGL